MIENISRLFPFQRQCTSLAERYDRAADNWHAAIRRNGYLAAYAELIADAAPALVPSDSDKSLSVLDAGAGSGGFSLALCDVITGPVSVDLLDNSAQMLKSAAENHTMAGRTTKQICADFASLDPAAGQYDVVLCAHAIEHCPDPVATLEKLRSALAPGGTMLLAVSKPHWCTAILQFIWQHRAYRIERVTEMLAASGFSDTRDFTFSSGPPKFTSHGYIAKT